MVQGLTNISIKNEIADRILQCQSLSDVCKLVKQGKREMENREAFTGISVETEESVEEVNWRQHNFNQRGSVHRMDAYCNQMDVIHARMVVFHHRIDLLSHIVIAPGWLHIATG